MYSSHHNFIFAKSPGSSSSRRVPSALPRAPDAAVVLRLSDPAEEVAGERDDAPAGTFVPSREDEPEAVDVALDAPFGGVDVASIFTTVRFSARGFPAVAFLLLRCDEAGEADGRGTDFGKPFDAVDRSEMDAIDCEAVLSAGVDVDVTPLVALSLEVDSREEVIDFAPRRDETAPTPSLLAAAIALDPNVGASLGSVFSAASFSAGIAAPTGFTLLAALGGVAASSLLGAAAEEPPPQPKMFLFCGAAGCGVRASCFVSCGCS